VFMISKENGLGWFFKISLIFLLMFDLQFANAGYAQKKITLVAGGDVEWSRITYQPDIYFDNPTPGDGEWIRVPYLNTSKSRNFLSEKYTRILEDSESHHKRAIHYDIEVSSEKESNRYPFLNLAPILRGADIAFINLETPLSNNARWKGAFRTPASFASAINWAGIDVANIANNHALDAEGKGLIDTIENLRKNNIGSIGGGTDLEDATKPFIIEKKDIKIAFLGYSQFENSGTSSFAQPKHPEDSTRIHFYKPARSGIAPMDPFLIKRNIKEIRDQVDFIVVSFHWSIENSQETHPAARKFAKDIIDAGADIILGHHPHVPRGIEVYKNHPIIYCPGNFIFGHNHDYWKDNYLTRFEISKDKIEKVEILPLAGNGQDLAQPFILKGGRADSLLQEVKDLSEKLGTNMKIENNRGVIEID